MGRKLINLFAVVFILMITSSSPSYGEVDYTKIGVENGDTFTFEFVNFSEVDSFNGDYNTMNNGSIEFYNEVLLNPGDKFTLKIIDNTPSVYMEGYPYLTIKAEFSAKDISFQEDVFVGRDSSMIQSTDWDNIMTEWVEYYDDYAEEDSSREYTIEYVDANEVIGYKIQKTNDESTSNYISKYYDYEEMLFEKSSGVLLRYYHVGESEYFSEQSNYTYEVHIEYIREGFTDTDTEENTLPMKIELLSLTFVGLIFLRSVKRRKHLSRNLNT